MQVPFLNLAAQYESLKTELLPAVEKVLAGAHYILGPNVTAFEQEVAAYTGARFGIGVNSGSDALTLALRALEIGPGDEVITPGFSYVATAEAVALLGAKPVYVDSSVRTYNLDPALLEQQAKLDPGNKYLVTWLWGFVTVGINVDKVKAALGGLPMPANPLSKSWPSA